MGVRGKVEVVKMDKDQIIKYSAIGLIVLAIILFIANLIKDLLI